MLKIHNVKVALDQTNYRKIISQVLNVREKRIIDVKLIKKSIDARRKKFILYAVLNFLLMMKQIS